MLWLILQVLVAIVILVVVVRFGFSSMRSYVQGAREQAEERRAPAPTVDVATENVRLRCPACGVEVLLTRVPEDADELTPLRHCREEMTVVSELST